MKRHDVEQPREFKAAIRKKIERRIAQLEREIEKDGPFYELDSAKEALEWVLESL